MPEAPKSSIFRKVSLERLSSPEQLDTMMKSTDPQGWLALLTIGLLLLAALLWSIFGTVPQKVSGSGIILRGDGVQEVFSLSTGILAEVYVKQGEEIQVRQKLGLVYDADAVAKMREIQGIMDSLRATLVNTPEPQRAALQTQIDKLQTDFDQTQAAGKSKGTILSQYHGRVVEVLADIGDPVQAMHHVFIVEPVDQKLQAMIYVSPSDGGKVRLDMPVQIFPDNARREEYGCINGRVTDVNLYPSSLEDLKRKFGNDQLAGMLLASAGGTAVQITVELVTDPSTKSGLKWSSGGPPFEIHSGTLCSGSVVLGEQAPIKLVLP